MAAHHGSPDPGFQMTRWKLTDSKGVVTPALPRLRIHRYPRIYSIELRIGLGMEIA